MISYTKDSLWITVSDVVDEVLRNGGKPTEPKDKDTRLDSLPMDSMDWAEFVVRMEAETGLDPFSTGTQSGALITLADLSRVYEETRPPA